MSELAFPAFRALRVLERALAASGAGTQQAARGVGHRHLKFTPLDPALLEATKAAPAEFELVAVVIWVLEAKVQVFIDALRRETAAFLQPIILRCACPPLGAGGMRHWGEFAPAALCALRELEGALASIRTVTGLRPRTHIFLMGALALAAMGALAELPFVAHGPVPRTEIGVLVCGIAVRRVEVIIELLEIDPPVHIFVDALEHVPELEVLQVGVPFSQETGHLVEIQGAITAFVQGPEPFLHALFVAPSGGSHDAAGAGVPR
mmetsp:Transcript_4187/g.10592  ORF Transcript_4187/g.10592 Transcript_4187/m.10592 type:complete len:264 (+) Transcript_4187:109-900(+)